VPGYTTVEHLIQTAFYQTKFGKKPRCAIYYVGWNDLRNAHIPDLDPAYADFHLPSQVDSLKVRRVGGSHVTISPLLTMVMRVIGANFDTVRYFVDPYGRDPVTGDDPALDALYERNIRAISAINRQRGVTTIWVGQLLNRAQLSGDGRYGWLPLVRDRDLWPMQQEFNALLARTANELGDIYVDVPTDSFSDADFVDNGHFSVQGAQRFADTWPRPCATPAASRCYPSCRDDFPRPCRHRRLRPGLCLLRHRPRRAGPRAEVQGAGQGLGGLDEPRRGAAAVPDRPAVRSPPRLARQRSDDRPAGARSRRRRPVP
jgi:hypothetical protein